MYVKYRSEMEEMIRRKDAIRNKDDLREISSIMEPQLNQRNPDFASPEVRQCWSVIDHQCPPTDPTVGVTSSHIPTISRAAAAGWRIVRVFVSSTFTDFFSEREILVKKVFPELREWCEKRRLTLVECDLRWGVPKDATTATTIETCLAELDRCHEETGGVPFFLALLGERYGWIPEPDIITADVRKKYHWVDGVSITMMEILHGAYRTRNPNAAFFFRDSSMLLGSIPDPHRKRYVDENSLSQEHIKMLKRKLVSRFPEQVFNYNCSVVGMEITAGRERVKLSPDGDFTERVSAFLKSAIERTLPGSLTQMVSTRQEQEEQPHLLHMENKARVVFGRDRQVEVLVQFAMGTLGSRLKPFEDFPVDTTDSNVLTDNISLALTDNLPLCVIAPSGVGKSALMARVAQKYHRDGRKLLYHAVGCSASSVLESVVLRRMLHKLSPNTEWEELNSKTEVQLQEMWKEILSKPTDEGTLLIVIDSLNEMATASSHQHLSWLPPRLPHHLRMIVSANSLHIPTMELLKKLGLPKLTLEPLTVELSQTLATHYLGQFNKKLDDHQMSLLCAHGGASYPQWLVLACEELRVYGDFRTLTEKIRDMPGTLNGLLAEILTRVLTEDDTNCMKKLLCMTECSPGGVPESEVLGLLGNKDEPIPLQTWAVLRRYLKTLVRATALYAPGGTTIRINFSHASIKQAVAEHLVCGEEERRTWHAHLADYYSTRCGDENLVVEQLPHHLYNGQLKARLLSFYRTNPLSGKVDFIQRRYHMQSLRCTAMLPRSLPSHVGEFLLCSSCGYSRNRLGPMFPARDICPVCAEYIPFKHQARKAYLCFRHKQSSLKSCGLCGMILGMADISRMPHVTHAVLCRQCGFGLETCCQLITD